MLRRTLGVAVVLGVVSMATTACFHVKEGRRVALQREGGKVWLEGVEPYRVIDPLFEGARLILASRGESYSPDYIQGISGSAFRIGGICPCAPTCENAMWPQELLRLLGCEFEHVKIEGEGEALAESTRKAVARVKQEIDAGRAALVWHAFTNAEWDVVYGYDAEKKQLLGRGSYAGNDKPFAAADEMRTGQCGHICCPAGVLLIGRKTGQFDAPKAEVAALREAVRHARDQKNVDKLGGEKWAMLAGLACYDRWIRDFEKPDKKRETGDAYCYGIYRSTHAAAAGFLREIAPKHPAMAERLRRAAGHFQSEAETLARGEKLLWWSSPEGPDPKRNAEAAALLKQARDAYAAGIAEIEGALAAQGAKGETGAAGPAAAGRRLDGLKQKPMWITHMGCLIGCAEFLKHSASPAWIYGGSGHAFALNVHEVICPSGPTAWPTEKCDALAANVGLVVNHHVAGKADKDIAAKREAIWRTTCDAIDAGTPCYGWELDVPEWYVIQGYDAEGNYLFDKFGQPGKAHHAKLGDTGIGWAVVAIVKPGKAADDRTVVREALRFALEHGAGKHSNEKWHTGLPGYDTWIKALSDDEALKDANIGFGHAYNAQCWAECRRHAVAFLEEAKTRLADPKLAPLFDEAVARYQAVSEQLGTVAQTFPFKADDTKGMDERLRDAARRAKAVEALKAARDAEAAGLKALARIVEALGT